MLAAFRPRSLVMCMCSRVHPCGIRIAPHEKNEPVEEEDNFRHELFPLRKTLSSRHNSGKYGNSLRTHIPTETLIISLARLLDFVGTYAGIAIPPRNPRGGTKHLIILSGELECLEFTYPRQMAILAGARARQKIRPQ